MNELVLKYPKSAVEKVSNLFIPENAEENDKIVLTIRFACKNIDARDFAAYMALIDNVYGRLSKRNLLKYSRSTRGRLKFSGIKRNSVEFIIEELIKNISQANLVIILALLLITIARIRQLNSSAYRDRQEGRFYKEQTKLIRNRRKWIREKIKTNEKLKNVDENTQNKLVILFDSLLSCDWKLLSRARRFSKKHNIEIEIRFRKKVDLTKNEGGNQYGK